jgi:hypothetical protein
MAGPLMTGNTYIENYLKTTQHFFVGGTQETILITTTTK